MELPGSQGARDAGGTSAGRWHPAAGRDFHVPARLSAKMLGEGWFIAPVEVIVISEIALIASNS